MLAHAGSGNRSILGKALPEMMQRFREFRQKWSAFYVLDTATRRPRTLSARDPNEADRLGHVGNANHSSP